MSDKKKKLFGFIDTRPLIWVHYILLAMFTATYVMYVGVVFDIISIIMFTVAIGIVDLIIHKYMGVD